MKDYFSTEIIAGNEVRQIVGFFCAILFSLVLGKMLRHYLLIFSARLEKKEHLVESLLMKSFSKPVILAAFALGLWIGASVLTEFTDPVRQIVDTVFRVLNVSVVGYILYCLVDIVDYYMGRVSRKTESKMDDMLLPLVGKSIRVTVVTLAILEIAQSISDKPVTSILAGLGVGGLAIALAGQDTVKNLFGSLVIVADKPFEIGDRIVFEGHDGPVESVGFRSTKIRTLDGHVVTIPNSEMVNKVVKNISKRPSIKNVMNIGVTYDTSPEKVTRALEILRDIFKDHEGMDAEVPPRIYFNEFSDSSLNIIVIFWYHPPDYWDYLSFCEKANMEILKRFNEEGIEFAFPTRTLYLKKEESS